MGQRQLHLLQQHLGIGPGRPMHLGHRGNQMGRDRESSHHLGCQVLSQHLGVTSKGHQRHQELHQQLRRDRAQLRILGRDLRPGGQGHHFGAHRRHAVDEQ